MDGSAGLVQRPVDGSDNQGLADMSNRKAQLVVAQASSEVRNFLLVTLVFTGHIHAWHIYVT